MTEPRTEEKEDKAENQYYYPETRHFDYFRRHFLKGPTLESYRLDFLGMVKIHGCNISLIFTNDGSAYKLHSRNRLLSHDSDLYDCYKNLCQVPLNGLLEQIVQIHKGEWSEVVVVGEWAGKGIMKGVGVSQIEPKFYTIFNIRIDKKWQNILEYRAVGLRDQRVYNICDFQSYKMTVDLEDLKDVERTDKEMEAVVGEIDKKCPVAEYFGIHGPGEGIVYTYIPASPTSYLYNFKVKGMSHRIVCKPKKPIDQKSLPLSQSVAAFVEYCITPARLDQGISYLEEMGKPVDSKSTGDYIRWVVMDALKEEAWGLEDRGLKEKDVKQGLTSAAREGWTVRLKMALRGEE